MNITQYIDNPSPAYDQCMADVRANLPDGAGYELITDPAPAIAWRSNDYRMGSNYMRVLAATTRPDMFYLDADATVKTWPDFPKKNRPYFVAGRFGKFSVAEWAFYVNGRTDFFEKLLLEYHNDETLNDAFWLERLVNRHIAEVEIMPAECFEHLMFSSLKDKE
jgi:hypothetical protein